MFDYQIIGDKLDLCNNRFKQTILHSLMRQISNSDGTPVGDKQCPARDSCYEYRVWKNMPRAKNLL